MIFLAIIILMVAGVLTLVILEKESQKKRAPTTRHPYFADSNDLTADQCLKIREAARAKLGLMPPSLLATFLEAAADSDPKPAYWFLEFIDDDPDVVCATLGFDPYEIIYDYEIKSR